jgi:hypothetical protein
MNERYTNSLSPQHFRSMTVMPQRQIALDMHNLDGSIRGVYDTHDELIEELSEVLVMC